MLVQRCSYKLHLQSSYYYLFIFPPCYTNNMKGSFTHLFRHLLRSSLCASQYHPEDRDDSNRLFTKDTEV